jgi:ribosomal protein S18 acetylase RimI-like enzyme
MIFYILIVLSCVERSDGGIFMESYSLIAIDRIDDVMVIYRSATEKMNRQNIHQWDEVYPDRETIERDIRNETLYGFFLDGGLCAVQVCNEIQSPEYAQIEWAYSDERPLVLHRLCVDPSHQNKGISKKMIRYAEEYAERHGYRCIRFDAFVENPISVAIYRKMGFVESGIVKFRKGDFYCFEKKTCHW